MKNYQNGNMKTEFKSSYQVLTGCVIWMCVGSCQALGDLLYLPLSVIARMKELTCAKGHCFFYTRSRSLCSNYHWMLFVGFTSLLALPMEARTRLNMVKLMYSKRSALKLDTLWHDGEPWVPMPSHLGISPCSAVYWPYDFMHII